ncbi:hypothetical protein SOHN41_00504 [Shewanella sp. HN-41]|nr:hypothetical protein SOHN41_00504 [Shewanella sp. HN-41]
MVYSFGSGVIGRLLRHKNVPVRSFLKRFSVCKVSIFLHEKMLKTDLD